MEETLGKRITARRKELGMTQDRLAEQLGVTAQAVSKWENDQSCPDITMLPKLAEIFGISIDTLLGVTPRTQPAEAKTVEPRAEEDEPEGLHVHNGNWEFRWDGGRRSSLALAVWVLMVGGLLLAGSILNWGLAFWDALWPSGLLVFGFFGIFTKFSIINLSCIIFGTSALLNKLHIISVPIGKELFLPALLLLFGLSLLVDALRKPMGHRFSFRHNGKNAKRSHCDIKDGRFECNSSFGENRYIINTPCLEHGEANVSFGELTIDLSGCQEIAPDCTIEANCSFGEIGRASCRERV